MFEFSAVEGTEDDAAVIVENRKTRPQDDRRPPTTNQKSATDTRRIGYLAAGQYGTDPRTGYLVDRQSGQPVPPPAPEKINSWGAYSGPP